MLINITIEKVHFSIFTNVFDNKKVRKKVRNGTYFFFNQRIFFFEIQARVMLQAFIKRNKVRRRFRLPQRSHLRTLKNFVREKSGKLCEKSGRYWIKSRNREILRRFIFFLYPRLKIQLKNLPCVTNTDLFNSGNLHLMNP